VAAPVEEALPAALPADVVILNPPRAGVAPAVMTALLAATPSPRAIVYVSCDPATLARDVARLPGWQVTSLTCFDMFPQTAHVESVCLLVPEAA
jgi:23S rRNA (uracil1939-C5)-methyltransferase